MTPLIKALGKVLNCFSVSRLLGENGEDVSKLCLLNCSQHPVIQNHFSPFAAAQRWKPNTPSTPDVILLFLALKWFHFELWICPLQPRNGSHFTQNFTQITVNSPPFGPKYKIMFWPVRFLRISLSTQQNCGSIHPLMENCSLCCAAAVSLHKTKCQLHPPQRSTSHFY